MGDKKKTPIDPLIATLVTAAFGVAGVFGLFAMLELGADQVAMLSGFVASGLTAARALWLRSKAKRDG